MDREEARLHRLRSALERGLNLGVPLRRVVVESLGRRCFVRLPARFVQSQLDNRNIRVRRDQKVVEGRLRQVQFNLVQRLERVAKVNQDQVAFVSQLREEPRLHLSIAGFVPVAEAPQ